MCPITMAAMLMMPAEGSPPTKPSNPQIRLIMLAAVVIVMILYGMSFEAVINELFRWLLSLL